MDQPPSATIPGEDGLRDAIRAAGSAAALARLLRITKGAVHRWGENGVPLERVAEVSRLTGVPKHRLRPDHFDAPSQEAA